MIVVVLSFAYVLNNNHYHSYYLNLMVHKVRFLIFELDADLFYLFSDIFVVPAAVKEGVEGVEEEEKKNTMKASFRGRIFSLT